jgi:hypothetical protein
LEDVRESLGKRRYQISRVRAAQRFEQWAKENPVPIQLTLAISDSKFIGFSALRKLLRRAFGS